MQWRPRIAQLLEELKEAPSVLRLSYLGDVEPEGLVKERLEALKENITGKWKEPEAGYELTIETEVFWRRGATNANGLSEASEMHLQVDQPVTKWLHDPAVFEEDEGDRTEMREVVEQEVTTVKVDDLVPPIHFELGKIQITEEYIAMLRDVLDSMRGRTNVRLHFVGHADSLALSGELIKIYGDNVGLSRERAGNVAEYCQRALNLPPEAISYEGLGDSQPVADNTTEQGRQLNRRVEVQVWYDEISEKQVEKEVVVPREVNRIKVCRTETVCKLRYKDGHAHRARVKNLIPPLHYDKGMLDVPEEFLQQVRQALTNLGGKQNLAVKLSAYTDNIPLKGRDKRIYGDLLGFSKAVARRVALVVQEDMNLPNAAIESEGRGASQPVASNDTQQGRAMNRRVEVEFWHDDPLQDLPDEP
ncbi:MAG: OmpA family protein, partial [Hyphomicrobiaceae bacterium]|nr:OmpA family protein [Hyphomicrobiaceae bacterium]